MYLQIALGFDPHFPNTPQSGVINRQITPQSGVIAWPPCPGPPSTPQKMCIYTHGMVPHGRPPPHHGMVPLAIPSKSMISVEFLAPELFWRHMAPYGSIWGPYGSIWGPYGSIWGHMNPYGSIWPHMGPYGPIWVHMGPIWAHMSPYGPIWAHMGPIWAHMGAYGTSNRPLKFGLRPKNNLFNHPPFCFILTGFCH